MGCFNMSCAVTNMPIINGDEMVIAFAAEAEQMSTEIMPAFFVAEYNDYGTYENEDRNSIAYNWAIANIKFEESGPDEAELPAIADIIRDLVDGDQANKIKFSCMSFSNLRVVYILKTAWDSIIHYQTHACDGWRYHNPSSYETLEQKVSKYFTFANEQADLQAQFDAANADSSTSDVQQELSAQVKQAAIDQARSLLRMRRLIANQDFRGVVSLPILDRAAEFCKEYNLTNDQAEAFVVGQTTEANAVSTFVGAINCNLFTRYASQDTSDEEQSVLVSIMHNRLNYLNTRWDE
jgi:hypothetical protein